MCIIKRYLMILKLVFQNSNHLQNLIFSYLSENIRNRNNIISDKSITHDQGYDSKRSAEQEEQKKNLGKRTGEPEKWKRNKIRRSRKAEVLC